MRLLGRAVARLAFRSGGQLMLEVPDDLDPRFVSGLIDGANLEVSSTPPFALFVSDKRKDAGSIKPGCDFHELAMFRQGKRLAVTYASDNSGMATYTSVYPLLLASGFPDSQPGAGPTGVGSLKAFATILADLLAEVGGTHELEPDVFRDAVIDLLTFLADAYRVAGNGQASVAADWWQHVGEWVEALSLPVGELEEDGIPRIYGCAGLPAPARGTSLRMTPREYVEVLKERWSDPTVTMGELGRLQIFEGAKAAAEELSACDWDHSHSSVSLRSDSPIARVAIGPGVSREIRASAWSKLREDDFKNSFIEAKGKLRILKDGQDLRSPWKGASPVLIASQDEAYASGRLQLSAVTLVIPAKRSGGTHAMLDTELDETLVKISGVGSCTASLRDASYELVGDGLHVSGTLLVAPSLKAPSVVVIEARCEGVAAAGLVDRTSTTFTIVRPDEVAIWARLSGRSAKSAMRGPLLWSKALSDAHSLELPGPGKYEFAVAWGESFGSADAIPAVGSQLLRQPWPGIGGTAYRDALDIADGVEASLADSTFCTMSLAVSTTAALSPVVAAAHGMLPDVERNITEGTLGGLENLLMTCLKEQGDSSVLGCILTTESRAPEELQASPEGVLASAELRHCQNDLSPTLPSSQLVKSAGYARLREAYRKLGLRELAGLVEDESATAALSISRISLASITREAMEELLSAYCTLVGEASSLTPSDRFWARNPFTVVIYPAEGGIRSASALLLSPLHPIRLAWLWAIQVGLRGAYDDGVEPITALALLDGTHFPAYCVIEDVFGAPTALLPVAIDAHPEDVYLGWHASVSIVGGKPKVPEWIGGRRFPVDGLSALSASSVGSAIDDFLRVSPHVQALKVELAATAVARRSAAIDDGILAKLIDLARTSTRLDGVAGIQVYDSTNRLGPIPQFDGLDDALALARPGFNASWTSTRPGLFKGSHITILEGSAAQVMMAPQIAPASGWLPQLPLRRTPRRLRQDSVVILDYALGPEAAGRNGLGKAILTYETVGSSHFATKVIPNLTAVSALPNWMIAADFGVDPQSLSQAATKSAGTAYVLWDWRPATSVRSGSGAGSRVQPYFVLAAIPDALNNAIQERLHSLRPAASSEEILVRTRSLVSTLAERAIGLNTLLSVGHHQATGALGFYFALRSLVTWMQAGSATDVRLIIPVDAVDAFLRASAPTASEGTRKRADLLGLRVKVTAAHGTRVILVPIEIKHYGLGNSGSPSAFPLAGQAQFEEHVEQLRSYQEQIARLCESYMGAAGGEASILGQRLAALTDAAIQLSPQTGYDASGILRAIASGEATVELGKGVLALYQAGGKCVDDSSMSWEEVPGATETRRLDLRVDPTAFDDCYWGSGDASHETVRRVMDIASAGTLPSDQGLSGPEPIPETRRPQQEVLSTVGTEEIAKQPVEKAESSPTAAAQNPAHSEEDPASDSSDRHPPSRPAIQRKLLSVPDLEKRYKVVLSALAEFNVKVERPHGQTPYQEGPGFIEFAVQPAFGVSVNRVEAQIENVKLRLKLPSDALVGCSTHLGNILINVPKPDSERYFVDATEMWSKWTQTGSGFVLPIGEDISGNIVSIDMASSNSPHVLIAGVTGSGKSEALLTMLHGATKFNLPSALQLILVDPKGTELTSLADHEHVRGGIGSTAEDAIEALELAVVEMESRYQEFKEAGAGIRNIAEYQGTGQQMARWLLVLDEYADLVSDDDDRKLIEKSIKRLSQKARAAGIHLILSTQKPVVTVVNSVVKGNLPGRIALRVNSGTESRVILDETGAEKLVGKGDAIVKVGSSKQRVQFARYDLGNS